jgi:MoxR-like ATPase
MRLVCLPGEYGSGAFDGNFWNRFRSLLEDNLQRLKWQGRTSPLVNGITAALMNDQAVFLLGAPGTGKTTVVTDAILPALREAIGTENELRFSEFPLTPASTSSDVFGFQGLDGNWVAGPFVRDVMIPYEVEAGNIVGDEVEDLSARVEDGPEKRAHVVFFDEANRVDIEALLSPIQSALDRMQARRPGGVVTLGRGQYTLPSKLWRIYAGNSPATDIGRKEQSRPFKRRLSVVLPPDPIEELVGNTSRFRAACLEFLERATNVKDVEVSEPALGMVGDLSANPARLEDLRLVLEAVRALPQVAVTVGLVESILLRAAAHRSLRQDSPIDSALTQSLVGLLSGDATDVERVAQVAEERTFSLFAQSVRRDVLQPQHADGHFEVDALL